MRDRKTAFQRALGTKPQVTKWEHGTVRGEKAHRLPYEKDGGRKQGCWQVCNNG